MEEESELNLNAGVSHKAVLQFKEQSDELAWQRISNATEVCWNVRNLIKTDVPEIRRPWVNERHNFIDKPLFVAVRKCGLVFATDDYQQDLFFYCQSTLPRKVRFLGTAEEDVSVIKNPLLNAPSGVSRNLVTWKSAAGITYLPVDSCI